MLPRRLRKVLALAVRGAEARLDRRIRALSDEIDDRFQRFHERETEAWRAVRSWDDWECFRDTRLGAMRRSLGAFPSARQPLAARTFRTHARDGYRVDVVAFESRPGLVVTANLYRPETEGDPGPGVLISHSHHNPKTQDELQDIGATLARTGHTVLVMDQLCHGERRQHPFRSPADYPGRFRVTRQDYFSRYLVGMQLELIGESLIGWMVWDLLRGVDLLLEQSGVDPNRIFLFGAVAGGGDPAAMAAALDPRITVVAPFGFGKEGRGSWEPTRNLRGAARDGFAPWVILGAVAGRRLIYSHEFAWEPRADPVWERLLKIWELAGEPSRLASVHGSGAVTGHSATDTHCNNIGPIHRRQLYSQLEQWFGNAAPREDPSRLPAEELHCFHSESSESAMTPVHELASAGGNSSLEVARRELAGLAPDARRARLRKELGRLLGEIEPAPVTATPGPRRGRRERVVLQVDRQVAVTVHLLVPGTSGTDPLPVAIGVAQDGGSALLDARSTMVRELLSRDVAVCLPEVRGTGGLKPGDRDRGRTGVASELSSSEMMLGGTLLGARLRDLRAVMRYLRGCPALDTARMALWGDSLSPANLDGTELAVPFDADPAPLPSEPLGGLLALLGALFEEEVRAVYVRGGLVGYASLLESRFGYFPHDALLPGVLTVGDLCDWAAALAPLPLRLEGLVDGLNRRTDSATLARTFEQAEAGYRAAGAAERFDLDPRPGQGRETAAWIARNLTSGGGDR